MTSNLLRIVSKTVALTTLLSTLSTTLMAQDAQWLSFGNSSQAEGSPPQVDINRSTPWNLDMNVTFPGMMSATISEGDQTYQQFVMPNSGHLAEIGQPQLPMVSYYVAVPAGASVSVDVVPPDFQEFGGYLAYPTQEPFPDVEEIQCPEPPPVDSRDCPLSTSLIPDPPFIVDTETYNSSDFYPSALYEFEGPVYIRGARIMILRLFPVQINPASQALRVYPQISVKFTFENSRGYFIEKKFRSSAFDELFNNLLVNSEPVLAPPQDEIGSIAAATSDSFSDNNTLLIITHDNFLDAANQLAAWKIQKGMTTTVKTTAEIGTDASTIQAYIQNAYDTWSKPPTAVLLIGDAEFIPPHYKTYHSYHGFDIGTDLYYATVDGSDYFPDINIGRLSVDTLAEATKRVEDIINYERNPVTDNNFYQKAAIAAYFQDDNRNNMADRRFAQTSEDVALFLSDPAYLGQYQVDRIYYTPNAVTPENWGYWFSGGPAGNMGQSIPNHLKKPNFTWRGNLYDISDAINEGRFLVTHRDHGTRWGWDAPYYHDTQASELTNGNKLPVVWSVNCETGWFDNETDHPSWTSSDAVHFSEVWERNPNGGAIGVIAATRVSYSGYNDRLFWGWADAIWPDFEPNYNGSTSKTLANHMGTVLNYGKYYLAEKYGEGTTRKLEFEIFHWFGDPTLPMWTQVPQTLSVSYDEGLTAGSTAVAVSVDTADALISVAKDNAGNGEILGRALSTQNQATTITWSTPLAAGDQVYLTITKHNYRPYQYDKLIESEYLAPITYLLTVNQQGSGSGEMTSTDGVIVCGDNCQTEYAADATVELTAKADADSIFSGWSLDCSGSEPQTTLTMDADKSCQANFEKKTVQLTIVQPSGGEVTSDDGLLSCGSNCEATYTIGDSVTLTVTPAAHMIFSGWSGDCSGTNVTTSVTLDANKTCQANFIAETYTLTVAENGGQVTSDDALLDCGTDCSASYTSGDSVSLTATPASHMLFSHWSGDCSGSDTTTSVTLNSNKTCQANFIEETYTLTLTQTGSGEVTSDDGLLSCGSNCEASYTVGESVSLTATPAANMVFSSWSGACSGTETTATVTVDANKTCQANFIDQTYMLTVTKTGSGTVTADKGNLSCGTDCEDAYNVNETVTLTAAPTVHSEFVGWSGACSGSDTTATVTVDADKTCQAEFIDKNYTLTVTKTGTGAVNSATGDIQCGTLCEAVYSANETVTLTATTSDDNMIFSGWSGACSGTEATTTVTLTANKFCEATFELKPSLPEYYLLTVTKIGDGSGSIKSAPWGIRCNLTCEQTSAEFAAQEIVTLTATVDEGSHFVGWSGACSGQQTEVNVTLDAAKDCSAEFVSQSAPPPNFHTLRVYKAGSGFGTVENRSRREEIKCGADCRENYEDGSRVALVATAAPFSTFIRWEGDCVDERRATFYITRMTMNSNMRCTAVFKSDFELAAEEMINLFYDNPENSVLINQYPRTAENEKRLKKAFWLAGVTLLQVEQHSANEWPHQLDDINKIATRSDRSYTQSVTLLSTEAIEIRVVLQTETGEGVEVPLLITYDELLTSRTGLDTVKISIPSADNTLSTWIESCRDSTTSTLEAGVCTERFERLIESGTHRLKVAKTGEGQGRIRFYTEQLNEKGRTRFYPQEFGCDYTCQETWYDYQANELVKLRAVASRDSVFTGWNGAACPSEADDAIIVMTMDQARTCVANFELSLAADTNTYSLNIDRTGSGHGVVNSRNARLGIACGEECNGVYEEGKKVALEAISSLFSTFDHWDEVCGGRVPTNSVTRVDMFTNFMCTAAFISDLDLTAQELLATFYAQGVLLNGVLSEAYPQTPENETRLQEAFRLATLTLIEVDQHQESWPEQLNGINQIAALSQATTTQSVTVMANQTVEIQLNLQTALGSEERVTVVIYYESTFDPSSSGYGAQTVFLDRAIFSQW